MANETSSKSSILDLLSVILEIQEIDMQMLQLMRLKKDRKKEIDNISNIRQELLNQSSLKEQELRELKAAIRYGEEELKEIKEKTKKLEAQQSTIKKVEEFNALSQEMSHIDRERSQKEQQLSDAYDKLNQEEELHKTIKTNIESSAESGRLLENEILERLTSINTEGQQLLNKRQELVSHAHTDTFSIYE